MNELNTYLSLFLNGEEIETGIIVASCTYEAVFVSRAFAEQQGIIYISVIGSIDEDGVLL